MGIVRNDANKLTLYAVVHSLVRPRQCAVKPTPGGDDLPQLIDPDCNRPL
jgi:hypothetical protein